MTILLLLLVPPPSHWTITHGRRGGGRGYHVPPFAFLLLFRFQSATCSAPHRILNPRRRSAAEASRRRRDRLWLREPASPIRIVLLLVSMPYSVRPASGKDRRSRSTPSRPNYDLGASRSARLMPFPPEAPSRNDSRGEVTFLRSERRYQENNSRTRAGLA